MNTYFLMYWLQIWLKDNSEATICIPTTYPYSAEHISRH